MNWPHEPLGNSAIIQFCKRLLGAARASEVKPGANYKVRRTAQGTFLEFIASITASGMNYREEYENDAVPNYHQFDVVQVSPANPFSTSNDDGTSNPEGTTVPGIYICWKDNPDKDVDFPLHPLQDGYPSDFWRWLATWPSEMTVCNSVTLANEQWFIDAQPKPQITVDDTRHTVDDTDVKL